MKQVAQNTFAEGMVKDLNPLSTPKNILTDCLNGTLITYNGNEFVLQNDMGNCKVDSAKLSPGFIPLGMKEYGGIVYVASLNPETGVCEIGSFPSPQEDFSTTDHDNIGPANFVYTDFIVDTGDDAVKERTVKNLKLFEPEVMQLHPGDMYVVLYTIHIVSPPTTGNQIIDNDTYDDFITQDPTDRKLFKLVFSKISDNNNLVPLDTDSIKVIPYQADVSDEYVYFKESSQATIAVGLQLEQLDTFDAEVTDTSRNTDSNKKITISAIGEGDSLASFEGIRVNVTSPVTQTFYLGKQGDNKKVSAILDGLAANDSFVCSVTPYSPYCLYPGLTKNFNVTIGQYLSGGSGVNNLFGYYLDTNFMKVEFDYKFQGNSADGIHLYVEFYDPWSDYSIIKTVDNPTYYGLNTVIMELVDEPLIDQYDSTTIGGTAPTKLITNSDTDYEKSILNSTNKIRTDQALRRNTFYIVRVSGVDKIYDAETALFTYQHYDFYKGLYTTDMFNNVYTNQAALSVNDPGYIQDFNSLNFDISKVAYQTTTSQTFLNTLPATTINYPNTSSTDPITGQPITLHPLMTGTNWYAIFSTSYGGSTAYKNSSVYETNAEYNIQLTLQGTEYVFGTFKEDMLSVDFPVLLDSDDASGDPGFKPTITEQTIPSTPTTGSKATWSSTSLGDNNYNVDIIATTTRNIEATAKNEAKHGTDYSEVSLIKSFHAVLDGTGPFNNKSATIELSRSPDQYKWIDPDGNVQQVGPGPDLSIDFNTLADDGDLFDAFESYDKKYSAFWGSMDSRCQFWWWPGAPGDYGDVHNSTCEHRNAILFLRNQSNNQVSACRVHNLDVAKDIFNTLKVASNITTDLALYSPDTTTFSKNGQLKTTFKFKADIVTNLTPDEVSSVFVKTYLSNFRFHALGSIEEFNPTVINTYIDDHKGDSTILDNKKTIRDGFIPYITTVKQTTYSMTFDDIAVDQAADSEVLSAMLAGGTIGANDPAFVSLGTYKPHGTLFSADSSKYSDMASIFKVGGFTAGVPIDDDEVYIYLDSPRGIWLGWNRIGGSPKYRYAPDLYQEFQFN